VPEALGGDDVDRAAVRGRQLDRLEPDIAQRRKVRILGKLTAMGGVGMDAQLMGWHGPRHDLRQMAVARRMRRAGVGHLEHQDHRTTSHAPKRLLNAHCTTIQSQTTASKHAQWRCRSCPTRRICSPTSRLLEFNLWLLESLPMNGLHAVTPPPVHLVAQPALPNALPGSARKLARNEIHLTDTLSIGYCCPLRPDRKAFETQGQR